MAYLAQRCTPSRGTRRATFGFQGIGDSRTCWTDIWSNTSPGPRCVDTNKLRSWSLHRADCGSHSGSMVASSISRMVGFALRIPPLTGEDVEDELGAIDHPQIEFTLQVALLRWRQLVIEDDQIGRTRCDRAFQLLHLPAADERSGIWFLAPLKEFTDDGDR